MSLAFIAQSTIPDEIGGQDLFPHSQKHHANDLPGVVIGVYFRYRATGSAHTTGKAVFDIFPSRLGCHIIFEFRV
jgi:hypothetical protein